MEVDMKKRWLIASLLILVFTFAQAQDALKVGFIYVGPVGDAGWTYAHDLGRLATMEALPEIETVIVEEEMHPNTS